MCSNNTGRLFLMGVIAACFATCVFEGLSFAFFQEVLWATFYRFEDVFTMMLLAGCILLLYARRSHFLITAFVIVVSGPLFFIMARSLLFLQSAQDIPFLRFILAPGRLIASIVLNGLPLSFWGFIMYFALLLGMKLLCKNETQL